MTDNKQSEHSTTNPFARENIPTEWTQIDQDIHSTVATFSGGYKHKDGRRIRCWSGPTQLYYILPNGNVILASDDRFRTIEDRVHNNDLDAEPGEAACYEGHIAIAPTEHGFPYFVEVINSNHDSSIEVLSKHIVKDSPTLKERLDKVLCDGDEPTNIFKGNTNKFEKNKTNGKLAEWNPDSEEWTIKGADE